MLKKKYLDQIKTILWQHLDKTKDKAFIFGSWAIGDNRQFSDIDIGIESKQKIPTTAWMDLEEVFEESDLPYTVDLVRWETTSARFNQVAKTKIIPLN